MERSPYHALHMSWQEEARCNRYDPELFFAPRARAERKAKAVCAKCPVVAQCLAYAIDWRVEFGIWGGLNVKERRALREASTAVAASSLAARSA